MKTFTQWAKIFEGRKSNPNTMPKEEDNKVSGKIDMAKLSTGHKPHMSGAGVHGEKNKPRKKNWKDQLD
jgi:hypothetical protein